MITSRKCLAGLESPACGEYHPRYELQCLEAVSPFFHAYEEAEKAYYFQGDDGAIYYFLPPHRWLREQGGKDEAGGFVCVG